tara:strand:+ start:365 stop:466 length:102 start_codon:yes stop_codon:yes gene_type:complete
MISPYYRETGERKRIGDVIADGQKFKIIIDEQS